MQEEGFFLPLTRIPGNKSLQKLMTVIKRWPEKNINGVRIFFADFFIKPLPHGFYAGPFARLTVLAPRPRTAIAYPYPDKPRFLVCG